MKAKIMYLSLALYGCCGTISTIRSPYDYHVSGQYTGDYVAVEPRAKEKKLTHPRKALVFLDFVRTGANPQPVIISQPAVGDKQETSNQGWLSNSVVQGNLGAGVILHGFEATEVTFKSKKTAILESVQEIFKTYNVNFTLTPPSPSETYITVRISPSNKDFFSPMHALPHGLQSYSTWDSDDDYRKEVIYVWSYTLDNTTAVAQEIAHGIGHTFGLEDLQEPGYIMSHAAKGNRWTSSDTKIVDAYEMYGRNSQRQRQSACNAKVPKDTIGRFQNDSRILLRTVGTKNAPKSFTMNHCIGSTSTFDPPKKVIRDLYEIQTNGTIKQGSVISNQAAWNPGDVINVGFANSVLPSPALYDMIVKYSKRWEKHANITFNFVNDVNDAMIVIGVVPNGQVFHYSYIGRQALANAGPKNDTTMIINLRDDDRDTTRIKRIVLHEFGHALGFQHENKSPASPIEWNTDSLYAVFDRIGVDRKWIDYYYVNKYSEKHSNFTKFDSLSIMSEPIWPGFILNEVRIPYNTDLSATDKFGASLWYPFPKDQRAIVETGDDCDYVEFLSYFCRPHQQIQPDEIMFSIFLDERFVTAKKGIVIPLKDGRERIIAIEPNAYYEHVVTLKLSDVDPTRPIQFQKRDAQGRDIRLPFTWPVTKAFQPRTAVQFKWVRDRCN
jgi:hypothetical protein